MKLFKSVDEKFKEIGFVKIEESEYGALYYRESKYKYTQYLHLLHKMDGQHIIQSYQKDINSDGFNNCVGLTIYETKLCIKKMKQMGLK